MNYTSAEINQRNQLQSDSHYIKPMLIAAFNNKIVLTRPELHLFLVSELFTYSKYIYQSLGGIKYSLRIYELS